MIFLVDDDQYVRRGFSLLLKAAGFESTGYGSAEEYLENHVSDRNDILILDLQLPGMTGLDLLSKFTSEGTKMKVIVITAYDQPSSREAAARYGVLAFLRKPVEGDHILDIINKIADMN
jgi:FixJ family two-component response regulator